MKFFLLFISFAIFLFSCTEENKTTYNPHAIKKVLAKGKLISTLNINAIKPVPINEKEVKVVKVNPSLPQFSSSNVRIAKTPSVWDKSKEKICTSGKNNILEPQKIQAKETSVISSLPEKTLVKPMGVKDHNLGGFSFLSKLQGLKSAAVRCVLQDNVGNLWFGTDGGATKYDGKYFTNYTENEGLSNNSIRSLLQDSKGNIWFGTYFGITKFDGEKFTQYKDNEYLESVSVWDIFEDKDGNIWFGTEVGLYKYDGKQFTFYTEENGLAQNFVWDIAQDNNGNMWFGTNNGISKFSNNVFTNFLDEPLNKGILNILQDKKGDFWFATNEGVIKYNGAKYEFYTVNEGLSDNAVWRILEDTEANIWFVTFGGGVCKYDGKVFTQFTETEGLNDNTALSAYQDKQKNLWFGTERGGVCKYNGGSILNYTIAEGLSDNSVLSLYKDKKNNVWIGSNNGLNKFNGEAFIHYSKNDGLVNNTIWNIFEDKDQNLWFGTYDGISKFNGETFTNYTEACGLISGYTYSIYQYKNDRFWFGVDGGLILFDGKSFINIGEEEGFVFGSVRTIKEDNKGNLWLGTSKGLLKYDNEKFTLFDKTNGLSGNLVLDIAKDHEGNLWIATSGGLTIYDGTYFVNYTEKNGLISSFINEIDEDSNRNLWFATRSGVSLLKYQTAEEIIKCIKSNNSINKDVLFNNYSFEDGFMGIGALTMCASDDSIIWVGANEGLTKLLPDNLKKDTIPPSINLTGIDVFNDLISWRDILTKQDTSFVLGNGVTMANFSFTDVSRWNNIPENLSLAYDNNYLTFNFIGITMSQPKNVKYKFMVEGLDKNWSSTTTDNFASYGNMPHGEYVFKVKAMNSEGFWSKPLEYKFTIRPPFWKTWWFRVIVIIIIVSAIVYYIKSREKKLIADKIKLEKTVEERTIEVVNEKKIVESQKHIIEEKHKEITDSINYAERIQKSFLATEKHLRDNLKEYFVLFKPKDIVSGDFYWSATLNNGLFAIATADSTGHGVPGAIMSLLNVTSLEKAIETSTQPADILNSTRKTIIERLKKDGSLEGGKDGMDCSLCVYDFKNQKLTLAASNNPVWIVRTVTSSAVENNYEVIEIKPDKMPVGKHDKDKISFTQQEIDLQKGDVIYTLTDGFPDQFGGPNGKKFMSKNLRELLAVNAHLPMDQQKKLLEQTFANWVGNMEQVDDVTLIGVRV